MATQIGARQKNQSALHPSESSIGTSRHGVKSRSAPAVLPNPKLHLASYRPTNESETFSAQCTPKYTTERIPVLPLDLNSIGDYLL